MYWCVLVYRWLAQPVLEVCIVNSGDSPLSLIFIKCADWTVAGTVRGTSARIFFIRLSPGDSALSK